MAGRNGLEQDAAPDPIEHAAPDVELAEAQLAIGRPDLADGSDAEADEEELELEAMESGGDAGGSGRGTFAGNGESPGGGGELAAPSAPSAVGERRPGLISRLINFLQGSWHELQRVQWPDRRQVMQATGVVIGFVIVAGVFLGVADFLSTKLMNYILTGHFK